MAKEYLYNVGDIILTNNNQSVEVLNYTHVKQAGKNGIITRKGYVVKCLKCGYIYSTSEGNLKLLRGCGCCRGLVCVKGINDINTTHPYLTKYFKNIEDAYKYTHGSNKKVMLKCPDCEEEKEMSVSNLFKQGFSCKKCSDFMSIPNKFMYSLLNFLNINFETEKTFDWSNRKIYDVYIPFLNCIIENHGLQHYKQVGGIFKNLKEEQENDKYKETIAKENGINHYIIIDCRKSDLNFIKKSVEDSELLNLLNVSEKEIPWIEIWEQCQRSLVKQACDLFDNYDMKIEDIALKLKVCNETVRNWLRSSSKYGWCKYDLKIKNKKVESSRRKKVKCVTTGMIYPSVAYASSQEGMPLSSGISACCLGKTKTSGKLPDGTPLVWKYI